MNNMQKRARAIIVENGKLLTFKRNKDHKIYWVLPGGGVEEGETIEQTLKRECMEELGVDVEVQEKLFEYVYAHEKFGPQHEDFYHCVITGGELGTGNGPEYQPNSGYEGTREIQWLEIKEIENFDLKPKEVRNKLAVALESLEFTNYTN